MAAGPRLSSGRDRTLAFALATLAHAVVLGLLLWRLGATPWMAELPVMNVQLVAPPHLSPPETPRTVSNDRRGRGRPVAPPQVLHAPALLGNPPADGVPQPLPPGPNGDVRQALRGILGCQHADLAGLSDEERRRCQDRMAQAGRHEGAGAARLNLDIHGAYGKDPEPYLSRRPKNGCKPRAAGDVSVLGQQGAAAGVSCAWQF